MFARTWRFKSSLAHHFVHTFLAQILKPQTLRTVNRINLRLVFYSFISRNFNSFHQLKPFEALGEAHDFPLSAIHFYLKPFVGRTRLRDFCDGHNYKEDDMSLINDLVKGLLVLAFLAFAQNGFFVKQMAKKAAGAHSEKGVSYKQYSNALTGYHIPGSVSLRSRQGK